MLGKKLGKSEQPWPLAPYYLLGKYGGWKTKKKKNQVTISSILLCRQFRGSDAPLEDFSLFGHRRCQSSKQPFNFHMCDTNEAFSAK